jgi:hypothetical protein
MNKYFVFLFLIQIQFEVIKPSTTTKDKIINKRWVAFSNQIDIQLFKPYEAFFDPLVTEPIEFKYDITCPLVTVISGENNETTSTTTGCSCNFTAATIECLYTNQLKELESIEFNKVVNYSTWNLDLRCHHFETFNDFTSLYALKHINYFDLSMPDDENFCKISDRDYKGE